MIGDLESGIKEGRAVSALAESKIMDGSDSGGQDQGHVYLFRVAFVI